jgi:cell division protease FtsH
VHTKKIPLYVDVDLEVIAKGTPGLSGADLANIVNEAALLAAKRNANSVAMEDFERAKDKVMMGMERKSLMISDSERRNTAYHEAGHVLVSKLTPGSDPVHKVTIIPRGRALGLTHFLPIDEKHNYSRSYLEAMLTHLLGGRAAEKVVLNEFTTGAGNDIERATEIARKMVCEWGMSEKLGPMTFGKKEEEIFLGREIAKHRDYSERTAQEIDEEVRRIIEKAESRSEDLVRKNLHKLHALADALLEREILDGSEIDLIMQGKMLQPTKRSPFKVKEKRFIENASETGVPVKSQFSRPRRKRHYRSKTFRISEKSDVNVPMEKPPVEDFPEVGKKLDSRRRTSSYIRREAARKRAQTKQSRDGIREENKNKMKPDAKS